jgi:transposase
VELPSTLEVIMQVTAKHTEALVAIRTNLGAIFVSLELSRSKWLVTSISPGAGEKMSKFNIRAGDIAALLARFRDLQRKAEARTGQCFRIVSIQEAGLDGFWIHRALEREDIESHIVDPASIATSRRRRRAKTDRIDGEALVRALLAYKRGEPRVCAMLRVPSPEQEDRRRAVRERKALLNERIRHVNRIKGLLFNQGISGYEPLNRDRRERLETLVTGDGRPPPTALRAQISRELDRLELLIKQIREVEEARNAMLVYRREISTRTGAATQPQRHRSRVCRRPLVGRFVAALRQPKAGGCLRRACADAVAKWPGQPGTGCIQVGQSEAARDACSIGMAVGTSSAHFRAYRMVQGARGAKWGRQKKSAIVALARKLLVALWKYVNTGIVIEGAVART